PEHPHARKSGVELPMGRERCRAVLEEPSATLPQLAAGQKDTRRKQGIEKRRGKTRLRSLIVADGRQGAVVQLAAEQQKADQLIWSAGGLIAGSILQRGPRQVLRAEREGTYEHHRHPFALGDPSRISAADRAGACPAARYLEFADALSYRGRDGGILPQQRCEGHPGFGLRQIPPARGDARASRLRI